MFPSGHFEDAKKSLGQMTPKLVYGHSKDKKAWKRFRNVVANSDTYNDLISMLLWAATCKLKLIFLTHTLIFP